MDFRWILLNPKQDSFLPSVAKSGAQSTFHMAGFRVFGKSSTRHTSPLPALPHMPKESLVQAAQTQCNQATLLVPQQFSVSRNALTVRVDLLWTPFHLPVSFTGRLSTTAFSSRHGQTNTGHREPKVVTNHCSYGWAMTQWTYVLGRLGELSNSSSSVSNSENRSKSRFLHLNFLTFRKRNACPNLFDDDVLRINTRLVQKTLIKSLDKSG